MSSSEQPTAKPANLNDREHGPHSPAARAKATATRQRNLAVKRAAAAHTTQMLPGIEAVPRQPERPRVKRTFSQEQKAAIVAAWRTVPMGERRHWCKNNGYADAMVRKWERQALDMSTSPDHVRDIAQLAVLNNVPHAEHAQPNTSTHDFDVRLGMVLGATIAEIIRRLR